MNQPRDEDKGRNKEYRQKIGKRRQRMLPLQPENGTKGIDRPSSSMSLSFQRAAMIWQNVFNLLEFLFPHFLFPLPISISFWKTIATHDHLPPLTPQTEIHTAMHTYTWVNYTWKNTTRKVYASHVICTHSIALGTDEECRDEKGSWTERTHREIAYVSLPALPSPPTTQLHWRFPFPFVLSLSVVHSI